MHHIVSSSVEHVYLYSLLNLHCKKKTMQLVKLTLSTPCTPLALLSCWVWATPGPLHHACIPHERNLTHNND